MQLDILKQFGLTNNDIRVYSALFDIGVSKTGPIISTSRIASSRVYESLRNLIEKGLVSYEVRNNIKYYQAQPPDQLLNEIEENTKQLKELTQSLVHLPIPHISRNGTNTYEGLRGFKMAYTQHVMNMRPGETASIAAFVTSEYRNSRALRNFFSSVVDPIMIKKKARGNMIANKEMERLLRERPDKSIYTVRYIPNSKALPYTLNISHQEVMMSVWGDEPIVFTIRNPIVVKAFQAHFDVMWENAKER